MTREEKERLLAEIEKQYKWLMTKSPTIYMIDIAFDAIRKAVREASKEQQEPRWIPVTERLKPKEGEDVLVANSHGFISVGYTFESWDRALHWRVDCDDPEEGSYFNPIAWQPLPEPYKAESEDKN